MPTPKCPRSFPQLEFNKKLIPLLLPKLCIIFFKYNAKDIKKRINKWDLIKIKSFLMAKEHSIQMKREPMVWENIYANDTSDKGLISKICKELTGLRVPVSKTQDFLDCLSRKKNNPIKKWVKDLNRHFSKEDRQRA